MELRELSSWNRLDSYTVNSSSKTITVTSTVTSTVSMWPTVTFSTPPANVDSPSQQTSDHFRPFHDSNEIHVNYPNSLGHLIPDANLIISTLQHLAFKYRGHYDYAKEKAALGWIRLWSIVEIILHWPLPVDGVD